MKRIYRKIRRILSKSINRIGNKKECYICGQKFFYFTKYRNGSKGLSDFRKRLDGVGSDTDNFGCMFCRCHDRERHLFMYFDKLELWDRMKQGAILHFAPERNLPNKILELKPREYIKADLFPTNSDIQKMDATAIPYPDSTFDFVIANHLLEHIPDYRKALAEFYRVLRPGGIAILQTPYSKLLKKNFEDEGIDNNELRNFFYGQEDHVRTFGEQQFFQSIKKTGFNLQVKKHDECFEPGTAHYYGVNSKEDLIMAVKKR